MIESRNGGPCNDPFMSDKHTHSYIDTPQCTIIQKEGIPFPSAFENEEFAVPLIKNSYNLPWDGLHVANMAPVARELVR